MTGGQVRLDRGRLDAAFELAARHVAEGRTTYVALAIATSEGLERSEAFGSDGPLRVPHRSAIASITKPITAVAVLQQVEAGALVLHEPVSRYLPGFDPVAAEDGTPAEEITPWHLLTHTSGLPDAPEAWYETAQPTPSEVVAHIAGCRPSFRPGSAYRYASDTFFVLAALVEKAAGRRYPTVLADQLFGPLGMSMTGFDPARPRPSLPLEGEFATPGMTREMIDHIFRVLEMPGGGLWSTPEDVARFGRAMLLGGTGDGVRVLGRPFLDLMLRRHTADVRDVGTGRQPDYGLGWGFMGLGRGMPCSPAAFGHSGATGSLLVVDPTYDLVFVYLRNEWGGSMTLAHEALQAVYGALA